MSRFDREAAFFDRVHDFGQEHPALDAFAAWAILTGILTITFIGPLIGTAVYDWVFGFDPNNSGQIAITFLGASGILSAAWFGVEWLLGKWR